MGLTNPALKPGITAEFRVTVTGDMRPAFDGQTVHDVLSTVSMIYYMELAGRKILLPYLEEGEEGAGYEIHVKHSGPAVVGQRVTFRARCTEVTPRRVVCEVSAETAMNVVGHGTFTQAVFEKAKMKKRIEELEGQSNAL